MQNITLSTSYERLASAFNTHVPTLLAQVSYFVVGLSFIFLFDGRKLGKGGLLILSFALKRERKHLFLNEPTSFLLKFWYAIVKLL